MNRSNASSGYRRAIIRHHIAPRLLTQMRIFLAAIAVILAVAGYRLSIGDIGFPLACGALALGTAAGFVVGRTAEIFWHPENGHVTSRIDALGVAFLAVYVVIEVGKGWFFGHWLEGAELGAFNLAFLAGLLLGRLLSMRRSVRTVLRDEDKLPSGSAK